MNLRPGVAIPVLCVALAAFGCSSGDSNPGPGGSGGAGPTGSGGSAAGTGGAGTGGVNAGTGGSVAPGSGGANATGGATAGTGGAAQSGGATGTGGLVGGTGGASSGGGATGTGGAGGATGSGGAGGGAGGVGTGGRGGSTATGGAGGQVGQGGRGGTAGNLKAAMVVRGAGTATAGDMVMLGRLAARGIQVTLFSDAAVTAAAVASMNLIVISSSAESGPLSTKLRDVAIPMLCIENGQYRNQGMTGTSLNTNYGEATGQTAVTILPGATALVGELTGTVTISRTAGPLGWGAPADTALKGATQVGSAGHLAVFGYEKGAQMVGMVAPARRAGFAIREALAANLTADGIKLFDAVLEWVLQ